MLGVSPQAPSRIGALTDVSHRLRARIGQEIDGPLLRRTAHSDPSIAELQRPRDATNGVHGCSAAFKLVVGRGETAPVLLGALAIGRNASRATVRFALTGVLTGLHLATVQEHFNSSTTESR